MSQYLAADPVLNLGDVFWDLIEQYGSLVNFRMLFADTLFTIDPAHVKRILSTEFENFEKGWVTMHLGYLYAH